IRSLMDQMDWLFLNLQSADKNTDFTVVTDTGSLSESDPIQIGTLGEKLFQPYYISFRTKVPITLVEILKANPFGRFKFTYDDLPYYGFLMEGGIKPATNDQQTWKLLCAPENDLSTIKIKG